MAQINPSSELEQAVKDNNHAQESLINGKAAKEPPNYIKIFRVLGDGKWHSKAEFIRPWSADLRRLQEMRSPKNWIEYEERDILKDGKVYYTEYRITKIYAAWWGYFKKYDLFAVNKTGQLELAGVA